MSASDYLLKPVDRQELVQAVETVARRLQAKNNAQLMFNKTEQMQMLLENLRHGDTLFRA